MEPKQTTSIRLSQEARAYIAQVQEERGIVNRSAVIEQLILEHREMSAAKTVPLAESIVDVLEERYKNLFTRIRLGVNNADRNSDVILEVLNSMIMAWGMSDSVTLRSDNESAVVAQSVQHIKDMIAHYKQRSDNKKKLG